MWRFLNSISRAFKNHVHSPRPSAGLYVEEEQEALELNERVACPFTGRRRSHDSDEYHGCSAKILNSLFVNKRNNKNNNNETTCKINPGQDFNTGKEDGTRNNRSCHHNFWRMFLGSHRMLEALSWGSAVLLGADVEKRRYKSRFLLRVLLATPGNTTTTFRSIRSGTSASQGAALQLQETSPSAIKDAPGLVQDSAVSNLEAETLDSALEEFQSMCAEYTAKTESLLGIEAAAHGNFNAAVEHLHSSCALGNMSACFNLGLCYETGSGVVQDLNKAKHYYRLAGMAGHSMALYNLGLMYLACRIRQTSEPQAGDGCDCGCSKVEGLGLLEKAAKLGLAEAQTYLGIHHIEQDQDIDRALPYFKAAAEQNDANAQYFLAICCEQGWGLDVNKCQAAQLYSQAASAGHEMAMYNLAVFNEHGLGGLPEDRSVAIELYKKSADLGCEQARQRLDDMKTSETNKEDWKMKIEAFHQLYLQYHKDDDTAVTSHHQGLTLNSSASSPNLIEHGHKDIPFFFGNHVLISQNEHHPVNFKTGGRDFYLGSDGDSGDGADDDTLSPRSDRSLDESFDSLPYYMLSPFKNLHKSNSQPNFSIVACNI